MKACAHCSASVADDQRYCLECGERQLHARSPFLDRFTPATLAASPAGIPGEQVARPAVTRSSNATIVAGVGVLLLAMGVGVLIGRAGAAKTPTVPAQVISVATPGAGAASGGAPSATTPATEASAFPEDWPAGQSGYAVQLQTLPSAGAQASEVAAAKTAALAKGASGVGVLLSSNFHSLPGGQYVIYSGDYPGETQAKQALGPLKAKFPSAAVIHVTGGQSSTSSSGAGASTGGGSSTRGSSSGGSSTGGGANGASQTSTSPKSSSPNSGKSFEQKSRSLPDVVSTG